MPRAGSALRHWTSGRRHRISLSRSCPRAMWTALHASLFSPCGLCILLPESLRLTKGCQCKGLPGPALSRPLCVLSAFIAEWTYHWAALRKRNTKLVLKASWCPECPTLAPLNPWCQLDDGALGTGKEMRTERRMKSWVRSLARWEIGAMVPFAPKNHF